MLVSPIKTSPLSSKLSGVSPNSPLISQLFLDQSNPEVSSWVDRSFNSYNFEQSTTPNQPIIRPKYVSYNGVDNNQIEVVNNPFGSDSVGTLYFSGYFDKTDINYYLSSSDTSTNLYVVAFGLLKTGEVFFQIINNGSNYLVKSTNKVVNGSYFRSSISFSGLDYTIKLNGVEEIKIVVTAGTPQWFDDVPNRDNLVLGGLVRTSATYSTSNVNRILYYNEIVSSGNDSTIDSFLSTDPSPSLLIDEITSNSANWADFATNWTQVHGGTGTSSVVANKLDLAGGSGTFTDYIYYNQYITTFENLEISINYIVDAFGAGLSLGIFPSNNLLSNAMQCFFQHSDSASFGLMKQYRAGVLKGTGATQLTKPTLGDNLEAKIIIKEGLVVFRWTNLTTGATAEYKYNFDLTTGNNTYNGGYFTIWQMGGEFTVNSFEVQTPNRKNVYWGIMGDSITHGEYAGNYEDRWINLMKKETSKEFTVMAAAGNTALDINGNYSEIDLVNPTKVLIMIGGNDIRQGASLATTQTRYTNLINHLKGLGCEVVHQTPAADSNTDLSGLASWISSTYSGTDTVVDIFELTKDGATTNLNPAYDSGDGTHLNATGQLAQWNEIKSIVSDVL